MGAQPSDVVYKLIKITGDHHRLKDPKGVGSTLKVKSVDTAAVAEEATIKAATGDAEKRKAAVAKAEAGEETAESKAEGSVGDQTSDETAAEGT